MGGHGGLNILPQKRWNVYNRDNRLKVARDEAAHATQQAEQQEKHRAAEAQARRQLLLHRAKRRRTEALGDTAHSSDTDSEHDDRSSPQQPSLAETSNHGAAAAAQDYNPEARTRKHERLQSQQQQQQQVSTHVEDEAALEHINFWKEFETKAQHPERQAEDRAAKKKRGNPDTYTTDARFDESFQLGYGLKGPKPWYARAVNPHAADEPVPRLASSAVLQLERQQQQQQQAMPAIALQKQRSRSRSKRQRPAAGSSTSGSSSDSSSSSSDSSSDSRDSRRRSHHSSSKRRRHSKDRHGRRSKAGTHKHKDKSKRRKERPGVTKAAAAQDMEKTLALARLRAERLEREAAERRRALEASGLLPQSSKRFNNSYGYADALRRDHSSAAVMATARGASAAAVRGLSQRFKA